MNFIEIMLAVLAGWTMAKLSTLSDFALIKPYLDRRLLAPVKPKTEKLPEDTQQLAN